LQCGGKRGNQATLSHRLGETMSNAIKKEVAINNQTVEVPTDGTEFKPTSEVMIKVSDSRKCVSIYGIQRMPYNFTIENWDQFVAVYEHLAAYVEANRSHLLSADERKYENQLARQAAQAERKEKARLMNAVDTATLAQALQLLAAQKKS
jgi:hypothetical protein